MKEEMNKSQTRRSENMKKRCAGIQYLSREIQNQKDKSKIYEKTMIVSWFFFSFCYTNRK